MAILAPTLLFVLGLGVLYLGAEGTLHGAIGIARRLGIGSLLIGLTLIAYGTSAPELAIDVTAAIRGKTDLAFGDLVGSNIANLGLILGVAVAIRPIALSTALVWFEIPLLIAQVGLLWFLCRDGVLSRWDGLWLLLSFGGIAGWAIRRGLSESATYRKSVAAMAREVEARDPWSGLVQSDQEGESHLLVDPLVVDAELGPIHPAHAASRSTPIHLSLICIGLFGLIAGAQLMVYGAVQIARLVGVSELAIGMTIVAVGTSLPELATSVIASRKNESDIVIGNVAGSNLFNLGFILALVACIAPIPIPSSTVSGALPFLCLLTFTLLPLALFLRGIPRWAGWGYIAAFAFFLAWQTAQSSP